MAATFRLKAPAYLTLLVLSACGQPTPPNAISKSPQSGSCTSILDKDKATLLAKVAKLEIGDSQSEVQSVLGKPSDVDHDLAKPSGDITGTDYVYWVKKCGGGLHTGWDDDFIRLTFGTDGRLELIQGIRVQGVVTRSAPLKN